MIAISALRLVMAHQGSAARRVFRRWAPGAAVDRPAASRAGAFGSLAPPSILALHACPLPDNFPYGFQCYRVFQGAQVSGFPAFGGGQNCSPQNFS